MINSFIEERANSLLKEMGYFDKNINLNDCAKKMDIEVQEFALEESISGFLVLENKTGKIVLNSKNSKTRKRFTLAHELAHFVLHSNENPLFLEKDNESQFSLYFRKENFSAKELKNEKEANQFAAALLMPQDRLYNELLEMDKSIDVEVIIRKLSRIFEVSSQAMSIRLSRLGILEY